jgi:hypothetical protein
VLEGNLDEFTLPDILRLLAFTGKSGRLALRREGGDGRVELTDGRVREASGDAGHLVIARRLLGARLVTADDLAEVLEGRDSLPTDLELARELTDAEVIDPGAVAEVVREHTVDAVFDLLRWRDGNFRFEGRTVEHRQGAVLELAAPVDELLTEAAARLESWPSVEERTGDGSSVVTISRPPGQQGQVSLSPDGWSLLSFVDGRRTVSELARLAGQGEFRTRQTLVSLLDAGVVTIADTGGPSHVERLLADHERLAALEAELGGAGPPRPAAPSTATRRETTGPAPDPAAAGAVSAPAPTAATATGPLVAQGAADVPDGALAVTDRPRAEDATPEPVAAVPPAGSAEPRVPGAKGTRNGRLRTDPTIDADLVRRLIDGVESL